MGFTKLDLADVHPTQIFYLLISEECSAQTGSLWIFSIDLADVHSTHYQVISHVSLVGRHVLLKHLERFILSSFGSSVVSQTALNSSPAA